MQSPPTSTWVFVGWWFFLNLKRSDFSLPLLSSPFALISLQSCITVVPQLHLSSPQSELKVEICLEMRQITMVERANKLGERGGERLGARASVM